MGSFLSSRHLAHQGLSEIAEVDGDFDVLLEGQ